MNYPIWHGTAPRIGGLMMQSGWVMISFLMLKNQTFSKLTAVTGIVTHGLDLIHIVIGFFIPAVGVDICGWSALPIMDSHGWDKVDKNKFKEVEVISGNSFPNVREKQSL